VGIVEENATVVVRSQVGGYVEVVLPPCALVPAVAGESFWLRADDLQ
jgi:hypothetical protein